MNVIHPPSLHWSFDVGDSDLISIGPDGFAWVSNPLEDTISVIDTATNTVPLFFTVDEVSQGSPSWGFA